MSGIWRPCGTLMQRRLTRLAWVGAWSICGTAGAHLPIFSDGSAVDAEHAIPIGEVQVSRVAYHEVTPEAAQVWIAFQINRPQDLKLRLGVPFIDRLADYRPTMVILGPGLPGVTLPFEIPAGLGGIVYDTSDVVDPERFDEPFTGTTSWILQDAEVRLETLGRYYLMAYVPSGEDGKLWVALGEKEAFSLQDIVSLPDVITRVRVFHEIPVGTPLPCVMFPAGAAALVLLLALGGRRVTRHRRAE
jgi:hypothetical protein